MATSVGIDKVINGATTSAPVSEVMRWLQEAGVQVEYQPRLTVLKYKKDGQLGIQILPFPIHDQRIIHGKALTQIAHLCQRLSKTRAAGLSAEDDLPNWLSPLFKDTPYSFELEGNHLSIYANQFPEFRQEVDLGINEAGVQRALSLMTIQLRSYTMWLEQLGNRGWVREVGEDGITRLIPPADAQYESIVIKGGYREILEYMWGREEVPSKAAGPQNIPEVLPGAQSSTETPVAAPPTKAAAPARNKTFQLSETLEPNDRALFEAMNGVLSELGITTQDIEKQYRLALMKQCVDLAGSPGPSFIGHLAEADRTSLIRAHTQPAKRMQATWNQYAPGDIGAILTKVNANHSTSEERHAIAIELDQNRRAIAEKAVNSYMTRLGRFQDIDPAQLTAEERRIYDEFNKIVPEYTRSRMPADDQSILQKLADGGSFDLKIGNLVWPLTHSEITFEGFGYQPIVALGPALAQCIKEAGLTKELIEQDERLQASYGRFIEAIVTSTSTNRPVTVQPATVFGSPSSPMVQSEGASIPYYTLAESAVKPPTKAVSSVTPPDEPVLLPLSTAFITPASLHRAKTTGVFRPVTFSEALKGGDDPYCSIKNVLITSDLAGVKQFTAAFTGDSLRETVAKTLQSPNLEKLFHPEGGKDLDVRRYYSELGLDADKWAAAIAAAAEQCEIDRARMDGPARDKIQKTLNAVDAFYNRYRKLDYNAKLIIAHSGVKFLLDTNHESGHDFGSNQKQGIVYFTPEFVNHPNFLGIILQHAMSCALDHTPDPNAKILAIAVQDMLASYDQLPDKWKTGKSNYFPEILIKAEKDPAMFGKLLPVAYLYQHLYKQHVKAVAHHIRTGEPLPETKATDTAFVVDQSVLTKDQQVFFAKLNEIIQLLGVTPAQFDQQFRLACKASLEGVFNATALGLGLSASDITTMLNRLPVVENLLGMAQADHIPHPFETKPYDYTSIVDGKLVPIHTKIDRFLGKSPVPSNDNVLQRYASGNLPLELLGVMDAFSQHTDGKAAGGPKVQSFFEAALGAAIGGCVGLKNITGEKEEQLYALKQEIMPLVASACTPHDATRERPQRVVPPEVVEQKAAEDTAKALAAQQEADRLAAIEAAKPAPYKLDTAQGTVAGRIQRHGEVDWKAAHSDAQQGILRMQYLQLGEIRPLLGLLNTKLPHHQDIGDVFFSEAVLRRAEYACSPVPQSKDKAPHPLNGTEQKARDVLQAWQKIQPEALPENERAAYLAIRDRLRASPALVIAALGSDQQLRHLRAIHNDLLPNDALQPVLRKDKATLASLEAERTTLALELLAPYGIKAPTPVQPEVAETAPPVAAAEPPLPTTPAMEVQVPVEEIAPALAAAGAAVAAAQETAPEIAEITAIAPPPAIPAAAAVPAQDVEHEAPTLYEEWRATQKERTDYQDTEQAALSSLYYINQQKIEVEGCRELECRLKSNKSGYSIQMTYSKEGKLFAVESLPLRGVTHIDDAMDIFLRVEADTFGNYPQFKMHADGKKIQQKFFINPAASARYELHGKPQRTKVNLINIQRTESYIPHGILDLNPNEITVVDDPNFVAQPPTRKKAFTEAKVIKTGDTATLVIHSWFASEKGNQRTCSQMNIPLGVDASQRNETKARATHALTLMQNKLIEGQSMTPQEVINTLRKDVLAQGKSWVVPKTHYAQGFQTEMELNFPSDTHKQSTRLSAGIISLEHSDDTGPYYRLQFRFKIGDKSQGDEKWYVMSGRGINLHTQNPELAEVRASRIMESVRELFNTTLTNGQDKPGGVQLPPDWRWDVSNAREGDEYIRRPATTLEEKRRVKQQGIPVDHAVIDARNIVALVDYAIDTYADDLSVNVGGIERGTDKTKFKLQLARGQRDAETLLDRVQPKPESEAFCLVSPSDKNKFLPVEVVLSIDHQGRSQQQIDAAIEEYRDSVEKSTRGKAWLDFKSTVTAGGNDIIKPRQKYTGATVVNGFATAVASNLVSTAAGEDNGLAIIANELNADTRKRVDEAMRAVGSRRVRVAGTPTGGHDGR